MKDRPLNEETKNIPQILILDPIQWSDASQCRTYVIYSWTILSCTVGRRKNKKRKQKLIFLNFNSFHSVRRNQTRQTSSFETMDAARVISNEVVFQGLVRNRDRENFDILSINAVEKQEDPSTQRYVKVLELGFQHRPMEVDLSPFQ